jgi:hypothetical protein
LSTYAGRRPPPSAPTPAGSRSGNRVSTSKSSDSSRLLARPCVTSLSPMWSFVSGGRSMSPLRARRSIGKERVGGRRRRRRKKNPPPEEDGKEAGAQEVATITPVTPDWPHAEPRSWQSGSALVAYKARRLVGGCLSEKDRSFVGVGLQGAGASKMRRLRAYLASLSMRES